jgi:hypothetical protein
MSTVIQWNLCNLTPEFSDILWHPTKMYGPKLFPLPKMKPEYSDILYNPTHFFGPLMCRIIQVPLYMISMASWPFRSDGLKMKYEYQDILLQFKIWDYLDMMFKKIWYLNTTDINPTHFFGPLVCRIIQVPLSMISIRSQTIFHTLFYE